MEEKPVTHSYRDMQEPGSKRPGSTYVLSFRELGNAGNSVSENTLLLGDSVDRGNHLFGASLLPTIA